MFGLTVNLNMFNLTGGKADFDRTVYSGLRDRSAIEFMESRRLNVSTTYRVQVRGSFQDAGGLRCSQRTAADFRDHHAFGVDGDGPDGRATGVQQATS